MTEYEPGTVAVATVRGVAGVRVFLTDDEYDPWRSERRVSGARMHPAGRVTDVRPLVVLDLEGVTTRDIRDLRSAAESFDTRLTPNDPENRAILALLDQIEAQTKPPGIPEPGLWGVVRAKLNSGSAPWTLVRHITGWTATDGGVFDWGDLIDPTLVREGVDA